MKKNLRIVSAAAAALLAVAPVAAAAVNVAPTTVQAASATDLKSGTTAWTLPTQNVKCYDTSTTTDNDGNVLGANTKVTVVRTENGRAYVSYVWNGGSHNTWVDDADLVLTNPAAPSSSKDSSSTHILAGASSIFHADSNTTVTINAVAKNGNIPSAVNGGISISLGGHTFEALLHTDGTANDTDIYTAKKRNKVDPSNLTAGHYIALIKHATVTLGNQYANTDQTFTLSRGVFASNSSYTKKVHVDSTGVADLGEIEVPFYAYDAKKLQGVHFYDVKTGNVVTSGSVTLHAVNGKLTVQSVYDALNHEYGAAQYRGAIDHDPDVLKPVNDIKDQLTAAKITVDNNGYFTAPSSFTINLHAKSSLNGAEATLPVTVNVDNATSTTSNEQTTTKTIMHIATLYDKNGKATNDPVLRAYNSVSVVATPVELKDASGKSLGKFYKIAGKDRYIKVGNIDGTVRTLKHNAYVYKSNGKARKRSRKHHVVRRSGSSITTYGKSFMIAGSQMYRVGRNQYIKKANFR